MKIGFYIASHPTVKKISVLGEGLYRYLAQLITELDRKGCKISIACPIWMLESLEDLFEEHSLPIDHIEFITPRAESVILRIIKLVANRDRTKTKKSIKSRIFEAAYFGIEKALEIGVRIKNNIIVALFVILGTILSLILLPFAVVFSAIWAVLKLIGKIFGIARISFTSPKAFIKGIIMKIAIKLNYLELYKNTMDNIRNEASHDIITRINSMKDPADIWYCPMAFFPEFSNIKAPKAMCFPDLIPSIFSVDFASTEIDANVKKVRETVKKSDNFIVYSQYQKEQILSANLGVAKENIISIPLMANDTFKDIDTEKALGKYFKDSHKIYARRLLSDVIGNTTPDIQNYLYSSFCGFSFKDVKYIFYSAQARPNKNLITLVKAYEYLLRKKEVTFKLILTCNLDHNPCLKEYVYSKRLQYDVLSLYRVSNQQLAALYACAELAVNPTIFEGGFPLTFAEGMSVGTPSVMGSIPQVTDVFAGRGFDECIFDPFNYIDMAEKILYGIENREKIYKAQLPLYREFVAESRDKLGKDYIDAFEYFIEKDKKSRKKDD